MVGVAAGGVVGVDRKLEAATPTRNVSFEQQGARHKPCLKDHRPKDHRRASRGY